jgi:hypothetical protein
MIRSGRTWLVLYDVVQTHADEPQQTGFSDTVAVIREATVKSLSVLAPLVHRLPLAAESSTNAATHS